MTTLIPNSLCEHYTIKSLTISTLEFYRISNHFAWAIKNPRSETADDVVQIWINPDLMLNVAGVFFFLFSY